MKILLTGHKGFIGQHLHRALKEKYQKINDEVFVYEWGNKVPEVQHLDWVIHIGAISSTSERDVDKVMEQNYEFSVDLYRECRFHGVNFQFASSASVYGLNKEFKESSPVDPRTPYAWSKYMFERFVNRFPPVNSVAQIFRYFNVYGPEGEEHKGSQASPFMQFKKQAETTGKIKIFEDSITTYRDFVPVQQVVDTQLEFMNINESGIFNIGTGNTMSFQDVAKLYNAPITLIPMPKELEYSYQTYTCADMTKTNNALATVKK